MLRWLSNRWVRYAFIGLLLCGVAIFGIVVSTALSAKHWVDQNIANVSFGAKPILTRFLYSYWWDTHYGQYWQDVLGDQHDEVLKLPLAERMEYYMFIIKNCDVTSSGDAFLIFYDTLGSNDASELRKTIIEFEKTAECKQLPKSKQQEIHNWIIMLQDWSRQ